MIAVPVAAVIEDGEEYICAVKTGETFERRVITLGQSDDRFVEIVDGLQEGEEVFLNQEQFLVHLFRLNKNEF